MNNLLLFEHELQSENHYRVEDQQRLTHIHEVLNKKAGDEISLCLVNKYLAKGKITNLDSKQMTIEVIDSWVGKSFAIKLIVAVSRPPTLKKILEHGTSLGVSEFHFFRPELTEKSFLESKLLTTDLFKKHLELGLSQSKVFYMLPTLKLHNGLPKEELIKSEQNYLLKMNAGKTFKDFPPKLDTSLSIVIGPERGLIAKENEYFESIGFKAIETAPSTLRVEIAAFSALSQLFLFS